MKERIEIISSNGILDVLRNPDPDYDGVSICYESSKGCLCDLVRIETRAGESYEKIHIYLYEDPNDEGYTRKIEVCIDDLEAALN